MTVEAKWPSLELRGLTDKRQLLLPRMVFAPALVDRYSGMYCHRDAGLVNVEGREFACWERPLIVVADDLPSTLAHEWRHHVQCEAIGVDQEASFIKWPPPGFEDRDYIEQLGRYFQAPGEADALAWERRMVGAAEVSEMAVEALGGVPELRWP